MYSEEFTRGVSWEALEHHHIEKSNDWYWALGIVALCIAVVAFVFGNFLFAVLVLVAAPVMAMVAFKPPRVIEFTVGTRGVRVGEKSYPYSSLESYFIDEESQTVPQLLLKSKQMFSPLIIMPIPGEFIHDIEDLLLERLPEEELEEPIGHKLLEMVGF